MKIESTESAPRTSFLDRRESGVIHFVKYHGLASTTISFWDSSEPRVTPEIAVKLCDRNFGFGADGVIFSMPGINGTDYTMKIFNSDGNEPESRCGVESLHGRQMNCYQMILYHNIITIDVSLTEVNEKK
ncbi:hypothetical protein Ddye_006099 [Dipteronia dyeriana]|uniref:Uncharacterized protein n=1 Tax=Dipteronia dyeriana TaxID=168575 RepID=A0AAD9XHE4_9ROSI|nr:hypothetical protein Ddye_006099 [Dipteronia dyeriana]